MYPLDCQNLYYISSLSKLSPPSLNTKEAAVSGCLEKLFQLASGLSYLQVRVTRATGVCRRLMLDEQFRLFFFCTEIIGLRDMDGYR